MASTYSNLKFELIGTGDQSGTWGNTTNTNLGTAIDQAISGTVNVAFSGSNVTLSLTNTNSSQQGRNLRLVLTGTSGGARTLTIPATSATSGGPFTKFYVISNELADTVTIRNATGVTYDIPAGRVAQVYCTGTGVYPAIDYLSGAVLSNAAVILGGSINSTAIGNITASTGTFTTLTATTTLAVTGGFTLDGAAGSTGQVMVSAGSGNTPTWSTITLGTMASQDASAVAITGGTITGISALGVAAGGTGRSSLTQNNVLLGGGTGSVNLVAPGTSGNVLTSNGTTWTSAAPTAWVVSDVSTSSTITTTATSYSITANTIMVLGTAYFYTGNNQGAALGVRIKNSGGATLFTYTLAGGNENNGGDGGSAMSSRSAWSVAVPTAAIGGTLEFYRVSGAASISLTINQVVRNA